MNKISINPKGGIAGDMFAAALISAGANKDAMIKAMWLAASKLGRATITTALTHDNATRLLIDIEHEHTHLSGHEAKHLLFGIFEELEMDVVYRDFGIKALQILIDAEKQAHRENTFLTDHHHQHEQGHDHHHEHNHDHHHHDDHNHGHHHPTQNQDAFLHEAQDILIDITGAAYGLQLLDAGISATLLAPVSLGGGTIKFSHGEMAVPAPATKIIVHSHWIPCQLGPIATELCTPTGASILAALGCNQVTENPHDNYRNVGLSRGGKDLPIEPLKIYIY